MEQEEKTLEQSFTFESGKLDVEQLQKYLATLSPQATSQAVDRIVSRSTEVDLTPEEREDIVKNIVFKQFHSESIEIVKGMTVIVRSLSEDEWQKALLRGGEGQTEVSKRALMLEEIVYSVQSINGEELSNSIEARRAKWSKYPPGIITIVADKIRHFHLKIREALMDIDNVKK